MPKTDEPTERCHVMLYASDIADIKAIYESQNIAFSEAVRLIVRKWLQYIKAAAEKKQEGKT